MHGIGEKFTANAATGTGSMSVPVALSKGRDGFGPTLALTYDSGRGNGPFGLGWSLSVPMITRRTDKGLPNYDDATESDVFVISDAEDLVPVLDADQGWTRVPIVSPAYAPGYRIDRYRPRIESLFARIERWTRIADGDAHWRSTSRDNVTTWYGETAASRITDPADTTHVFSWLVSRSQDDKGNAIVYEYVPEDAIGVDVGAAHERNRDATARGTGRHLKRIHYGNRVSHLADPALAAPDWMFEVVLDYGDHDPTTPMPNPSRPWVCREDPFSSYRSGYEVRTYRLCDRILMFHHFPDEPDVGADCLVRSTDLAYRAGDAGGSVLTSATARGYRRDSGGYVAAAMPPVEFGYSEAVLRDDVRELDADSLANLPAGLAGPGCQWVDLDGDGVAGMLLTADGAWYYKANLGQARFAPAEPVPSLPTSAAGRVHLVDLAGDGRLDLVSLDGDTPGFFGRTADAAWTTLQTFRSLPTIDWTDPDLRVIDLDGDGHADVLITEDDAIVWYPSLAEDGFSDARRVPAPRLDDDGPRLIVADGTDCVLLADMSGDGLTDLVRVRNGEVCYWPNLGYGRFGRKVTMDDAPWFDRDELYDPRRLTMADVDGSGVTDLIYFGAQAPRIYLNRSGNGWAPGAALPATPEVDDHTTVTVADLFGTGTACLVWSTQVPGEARRSMRYLDLYGGEKPHLLTYVTNNLGAETTIRYASSTTFYLADKAAGRPWLTRLPFPVNVVERVETSDRVAHSRYVNRYAYHHGYFDGAEREFRGFGMVEQWDTEEIAAVGAEPGPSDPDGIPPSVQPPIYTKTWFHTGVFVDVGASVSRQFARDYWREPGLTDAQDAAMLPEDSIWPAGLRGPDGTIAPYPVTADELREAGRALKSCQLRQEIYAADGSDVSALPYRVTEHSYTVDLLQPMGVDRHAVCFCTVREMLDLHYERARYAVEVDGGTQTRFDPRVTHDLTLDVDGWGNVLRSAHFAYGRRWPDADLDPSLTADVRDAITAAQTTTQATLTVTTFTNSIDDGVNRRAPGPSETSLYELIHLAMPVDPGATSLVRIDTVRALADAAGDGAHDLPFEDTAASAAVTPAPYRRLLDRSRIRYRADDLTGDLPPGVLESMALPYESYRLAFTPSLLIAVYQRSLEGQPAENLLPDAATVLGTDGGYVEQDGGWWIPSGQVFYSPDATDTPAVELATARAHFFLARRHVDPYGGVNVVHFDRYDLLMQDIYDPVGTRVSAGSRTAAATPEQETLTVALDYRVLAAWMVSDGNRNRSAVLFDALGLVVASAIMGKPEEQLGDSIDGLPADLSDAVVAATLADPLADPASLLGSASSRLVYDFFAYRRTRADAQPQPVVTYTLGRETHVSALAPQQTTRFQHRMSYSDGYGREVQVKVVAKPGLVSDGGPTVSPRWLGSGWTIYDNKGQPVRRYEPFFSTTHAYEFAKIVGVSALLCYDPMGRVAATLMPDNTYAKTVFDPWRHAAWDGNDTVLLDPRTDPDVSAMLAGYFAARPPSWQTWHQQRSTGALGADEQRAAVSAETHAGTPAVGYADALGRVVVTVAHNRYVPPGSATATDEYLPVRTRFDVEGARIETIDARGNPVLRSTFDIAGRAIRTHSPDAGDHWYVPDVNNTPILRWDGRGFRSRHRFDAIQRPVQMWVTPPGAATETLAALTVYGEGDPFGVANNLRGRARFSFDGAGLTTTVRYDFKGNLLAGRRQLAKAYQSVPDWSSLDGVDQATIESAAKPLLDDDVYATAADFDALNRPVVQVLADTTVLLPRYNEAGLLETVSARLPGTPGETPFLTGLDYDAHGNRIRTSYANGITTDRSYDPATLRLRGITTRRGGGALQDLTYVNDPSGNIVAVTDAAAQTVFFAGQVVPPSTSYVYDAMYRLIEANGREHASLGVQPDGADPVREPLPHPNDAQAMRTYTERYTYDPAGNIRSMAHVAGAGSWTRTYQYTPDANKLLSHSVPGTPGTVAFTHDANGNMTAMPHLGTITFDHHDQMTAVDLGPGGGTSYYTYDGGGQRIRRVVEHQGGLVEERIYLGGVEIYRRRMNGTPTFERQTVHILDDLRRLALVELTTLNTRTPADQGQRRIRYQYDDNLSSARLETDENAAVITYEEYHPYGTTSLWLSTDAAEVSAKRYRYTGKERDNETGLYYHGARYYSPWLARWTSCDPAGVRDGESLYLYVKANPIRFLDPDGADCSDNARSSVPILGALMPGHAGWTVRPQLNPCLDGHPAWQQWHAETERRAGLASATFHQQVTAAGAVALASAPVVAFTLVYGGAAVGELALTASEKAAIYALGNPARVALAHTLLQFGIGMVDPHPPGFSPLETGPGYSVGHVVQAEVREMRAVLSTEEVVKKSVSMMAPPEIEAALKETWELDKSGMARFRGEILEGVLAATRYRFYEWVGRLKGGMFPTLDFLASGIGIQVKTLNAVPSVSIYKGFIDKLVAAKAAGQIEGKVVRAVELDIATPGGFRGPAGREAEFADAIKQIVDYGKQVGVKVEVFGITQQQMNLVQAPR